MENDYLASEKKESAFFEKPTQPEFVWRNLAIGICVVIIVIFFIYLGISQSVKSSDYKPMNLSTQNQQDSSVAGASTYGPPDGSNTTRTKVVTKPTPTSHPTAAPTTAPTSAPAATAAPTSAPEATATPVPPTATPTPTPTDTPTSTPTPTPTDTPTP